MGNVPQPTPNKHQRNLKRVALSCPFFTYLHSCLGRYPPTHTNTKFLYNKLHVDLRFNFNTQTNEHANSNSNFLSFRFQSESQNDRVPSFLERRRCSIVLVRRHYWFFGIHALACGRDSARPLCKRHHSARLSTPPSPTYGASSRATGGNWLSLGGHFQLPPPRP